MSLYSRILETILFPKGSDGLVVLPTTAALPAIPDWPTRYLSELSSIPEDLFPEYCTIERLAEGEFAESLERLIIERRPERLFVFVPWFTSEYPEHFQVSPEVFGEPSLYDVYHQAHQTLAVIERVLSSLEPTAKVGLLVSRMFLTGFTTRKFRMSVVANHHLDLVLEHAHSPSGRGEFGEWGAHTTLASVVISHTQASTKPSDFFRFETADGDTIERELSDIHDPGWTRSEHGFRLPDGLNPRRPNLPWTYLALDPARIRGHWEVVKHFGGDRLPLSELADPVPRVPREAIKWFDKASNYSNLEIPVLLDRGTFVGWNVSLKGEIEVSRVPCGVTITDCPQNCLLRQDDLVIRAHYPHPMKNLEAHRIVEPTSPVALGDGACALRRKEGISAEQWTVVHSYLRSEQAFNWLLGLSITVDPIDWGWLWQLNIPRVSADVQMVLRQLGEAETAHLGWAAEAREALNQVFTVPDSRVRRYEILETSRRVRQRWDAAKEISESKTRARRLFPHPIAYRWKVIETAYPDYEGYKNILECAEVTIAYLASVALMAASEKDIACEEITKEASKMAKGRGTGKTFGYWRRVMAQLRDAMPLEDPYSTPFYEFFNYPMTNQAIADLADEAFHHLYEQRNKDAHNAGPKGFEVKSAYTIAYEKLQFMLEAASFLTEFPLVYIEDTRLDTLRKRTYFDARELMGDHNLVSLRREIETDREDLEKKSLYVQDREGKLHLLRPYLIYHQAAKENRMATYYLNTYDPDTREATLRSLELGDTVPDTEIDKYVQAGLLTLKP